MKRPNSMRHLDDAIRRECGGDQAAYVRLRTLMANAVVARMLPDGVVKGGSAIKMRYGNARTRYTTDLDTATATDPAAYAELLGAALACGWEGFTGRVVPKEPAHPRDVPEEYVMRPFDIRLAYLGKPWCTVPLEVGHDEIGDAGAATRRTCERLFAYRQGQAWPPTVVAREGWDEQYRALAEGLAVIQDVGEAVEWANALVSRIAMA